MPKGGKWRKPLIKATWKREERKSRSDGRTVLMVSRKGRGGTPQELPGEDTCMKNHQKEERKMDRAVKKSLKNPPSSRPS